MTELPAFGPWSPALADPVERKAQLRALQALVKVFVGPDDLTWPLIEALRAAEDSPLYGTLQAGEVVRSKQLFDQLPALAQRRIIATLAGIDVPAHNAIMLRKRKTDGPRSETPRPEDGAETGRHEPGRDP